jgi:hypothetical protein
MRVYEKKQYIYVLTPKEQEEKGRRLIIDDLVVNKNIWNHYEINEPTIDKNGDSVYLIHAWC